MLEINTSKIKNTVTFTVDKESLKEAKDSIKSVKTFAEGIKPSLDMSKMRKQMQEMERHARRVRDMMRGYGGGNPPPHPPGGNPPPSPPPSPRPPKGDPAAKAAAKAAKRSATADMKMENFSFNASRFPKADLAAMEQARKITAQTAELYRREEITLARLNQTMAHQLDSIRRSHRAKVADIEDEVKGRRRVRRELENEAKLKIRIRERERRDKARADKRERDARQRDRARRYDRVKEGALGLNPGMIGSALLGAGLVAGFTALQQTLSKSAERTNLVSRGAQNVQTNPNAVLAMESWGRVNGVDSANIIKAIDNIKDVRERLGNSVMMSKLDPKDGKWKGGDSGINDIMNQFGWNKEQIAQFQNRPLDFVTATVKEGQRRGMNSAQIGRLMENLGDDLMHYQRMFLDGGKEFLAMVTQLTQTGGALNEEQITAAQNYTVLAEKLTQFGNGFQANMVVGFMDAMKAAPEFAANVPIFMQAAKQIGESSGQMAVALAKLAALILEYIPDNSGKEIANDTFLGMQYYKDTWLDKLLQHGRGALDSQGSLNSIPGVQNANLMAGDAALGPNQVGIGNSYGSVDPYSFAANRTSLAGGYNPLQSPIMLQSTLTIPDSAFQVNIVPDGYGFDTLMNARFSSNFDNITQGLTLQMSSGQSSTGG